MDIQIDKPMVIDALVLHLVSPTNVCLSGTVTGTTTADSALAKRLEELHGHVVARGLPSFTIDVRLLSFVNSSAIRLFVTWVSRAQQTGYKTIFITDESVTWHRLSFSVLKSMAPGLVEIRSSALAASAQGHT